MMVGRCGFWLLLLLINLVYVSLEPAISFFLFFCFCLSVFFLPPPLFSLSFLSRSLSFFFLAEFMLLLFLQPPLQFCSHYRLCVCHSCSVFAQRTGNSIGRRMSLEASSLVRRDYTHGLKSRSTFMQHVCFHAT